MLYNNHTKINNSESVMEIPMDNDNILIDVDNLEDFQRVSKAFVN